MGSASARLPSRPPFAQLLDDEVVSEGAADHRIWFLA